MKMLKGAMPKATKAAPARSMPTLAQRAKLAMKGRAMKTMAPKAPSRAMRNRPSLAQPRSTRKAR
jgi:hypothetical protein